jgi:hypothetical protein
MFRLDLFRADRIVVGKFVLRGAARFALLTPDAEGCVIQERFAHGNLSGPRLFGVSAPER